MIIIFATIGGCVGVLISLLVSLNLTGYPITIYEAIGYPLLIGIICGISALYFGGKKK